MVRRARFADGTPKPLPKPERNFADKLKTLKSVSQGISPESRLRLLDYFIQEALTKGQLTEEQASGIYDKLREDKDKIREQIDTYERENFSEGSKDEQRKIADDEYYASLQKIIERDPGAKKFFDPDDITYPAMSQSGNYNYKGIQVQTDDIDKFKKYAERRGLDKILSPESTFEEKIKKGQYPVGIFERPVETGTEPMDLRKMQTILHEARHKIMMKPEFQKIMDKYFLKEETFVRYLDKEFFPELDAYLPDFEYPEEADKVYKKAVEEYKDKFTKEDKGFINKLKSFFAEGGRANFSKGTSLMDEYLGAQKEYQKAVDNGFQGTYEEFLRYKSSGSFADGGRIGFYKGELVTDGPNKGKYKVKFANKGTSPGYPDEFIGTQYYDSEALANQAIEDRKVFSKKNIEARNLKNVEMGKAKKTDYKKIIDSFIEKGDYENFKTQLYESQMVELPSGKQRRTTGGRVPQHILKFIRDRLDAGPGTELFEELKEITGRTDAELLEFKSKIPEKGYIPVKDRSQTAIETSGVRKTDEEKLETQQKAKRKRAESELVGKKYASEAELERFKVVNNQKKKLNKFFQENHKTIFNTDFGKKVRELMDVRIDSEGNFFKKNRPDSYYVAKAKEGKIFDIFDINKISKGQVNTKYTSNLNILPGQFNQAFIEGQVNKYFKAGGKLHGNTAKLNNVSNYLDSIGVKVDIEDVGRIGGGDKVFFDSKTNSYPHITNTLKKMNIPNDLITDVNPTKGLKDMFPNVAKYGGKLLTGASKVAKPLSVVMGPYAVLSAQDKAKAAGIDLNLSDQAMAFYMGDPDAAMSMYKMRTDPEYAAAERAKTLAIPLDEGTYDVIDTKTKDKSTFGKYNDQIKNIKLP